MKKVRCISNITRDGLTDPYLIPGRIYTVVEDPTLSMAGEYMTVRLGPRDPDYQRPRSMFMPIIRAHPVKKSHLRIEIEFHADGHQRVTAVITMPDGRNIHSDMHNISPVDAWHGFNRPPVRIIIVDATKQKRSLNAVKSSAFMRADPVRWTVDTEQSSPSYTNPTGE
jgi:hypothetical protein